MMTSTEILNAKSCEDIFVNDITATKELFRQLAKQYHPDISKEKCAIECFQKLNTLYNEALDKISKGIWYEKDVILLESKAGKKYKLKYLIMHPFELGAIYVGSKHLIYVLDKNREKFYKNYLDILKKFKYASSEMEREFKRFLPNVVDTFELKTGEFCIVISKSSDEFLLPDILEMYKSKSDAINACHAAWINSRLLNLSCFFKYNNIVYNGFSPINCLINPKEHNLILVGGFWYSTEQGEKMIGTSSDIFDVIPVSVKTSKCSSFITDIESIRMIIRKLNSKNMPEAFVKWVDNGSTDDAFLEFKNWEKALLSSFGERKFIPLDLSEKDIYK